MTIYIIEKYEFWDGEEIIYVSDNYNRALSLFKELKNNMATGIGLHLRRYKLNVLKRNPIEKNEKEIQEKIKENEAEKQKEKEEITEKALSRLARARKNASVKTSRR